MAVDKVPLPLFKPVQRGHKASLTIVFDDRETSPSFYQSDPLGVREPATELWIRYQERSTVVLA
jgi:hypothetical protein